MCVRGRFLVLIGISLTTITHSIIPFELNSSRPRLVAAVCQDLKKINSAETIRGNTVVITVALPIANVCKFNYIHSNYNDIHYWTNPKISLIRTGAGPKLFGLVRFHCTMFISPDPVCTAIRLSIASKANSNGANGATLLSSSYL